MNLKIIRMTILILSVCLISCNAYSDKINWLSYDEGLKLAQTENKKVFLHFWAAWCGYCTKMETTTFNDTAVSDYLNENFIPVKVNTDKEKTLAVKYKVRGLPDTWFLTGEGEPISDIGGYIPPGKLLPVLKYISTDSYKTQNFNKFMEF
ncbi:MAG: thioredoxin fold domain-containing protein [Deltaproteobacteria bacterium]|nr:thioredoxin fold domain-containing protein [Deltaproteobacteria bacterium]